MYSIEYNLSLLDTILDDFNDYLLSSEIFWPLSRRSIEGIPVPRLTMGGLILTIDELEAQEESMDLEQKEHYRGLLQRYEASKNKWTAAIERKSSMELPSRLNLWRSYLQDLENRPNLLETYSREVRNRVMISRLLDISKEDKSDTTITDALKGLDGRVLEFFKPGAFIWDTLQKSIYPKTDFPYLYVEPRKSVWD